MTKKNLNFEGCCFYQCTQNDEIRCVQTWKGKKVCVITQKIFVLQKQHFNGVLGKSCF